MKIASVVCAFPPYSGGMGNSAQRIGRLLAEKHEVVYFTPNTLHPWLHYGHGAFLPQLLWKLKDFDYIYLHYPFFGTAEVVWLYKLLGGKAKLIIHYHMDVKNITAAAKILSWPSLMVRRSLLDRADVIVAASLDYIKNSQIKKYYNEHPEKFREIPFGLDITTWQPSDVNRPAQNRIMAKAQEIVQFINDKFIKKNRLDLLFVGGLDRAHYFKGVKILLSALAELQSYDWRLTIVGDGELRAGYETQAEELGIAKRVNFTGKLCDADLIRAYQAADLFVLPSINTNEAFGLVLTEALACGVPVIASDLPGVRSVFTNYQEGLLAEPGNITDLANKIEFIFNNEDLRRQMAVAARHLAEKKYDLKIMKAKLNELIK